MYYYDFKLTDQSENIECKKWKRNKYFLFYFAFKKHEFLSFLCLTLAREHDPSTPLMSSSNPISVRFLWKKQFRLGESSSGPCLLYTLLTLHCVYLFRATYVLLLCNKPVRLLYNSCKNREYSSVTIIRYEFLKTHFHFKCICLTSCSFEHYSRDIHKFRYDLMYGLKYKI
jgi:hypothetical protein